MIGRIMVDASIAVGWVHAGQRSAASEATLALAERGIEIVVPGIWFSEVGNVLLSLQRRN
jgi:hypothetical protein